MKNLFILITFFPVCSFGAGFNEVPWVKYTKVSHGDTWSRASVNLPDSMANSFSMNTYAYTFYEGYDYPKDKGATTAEAGAIKTSFCDTAPFIFKAYVSYRVEGITYPWYGYNGVTAYCEGLVSICINGVWSTALYKKFYTIYGVTDYYSDSACINITSGFVNGIKVASSSYAYTSCVGTVDLWARNDNYSWVCINFIGVEEKADAGSKMQDARIKVEPNPFTQNTNIRLQDSRFKINKIHIYDVSGKLVEETKDNIIGENLEAGIYFVKVGEYKLIKIVKLK